MCMRRLSIDHTYANSTCQLFASVELLTTHDSAMPDLKFHDDQIWAPRSLMFGQIWVWKPFMNLTMHLL